MVCSHIQDLHTGKNPWYGDCGFRPASLSPKFESRARVPSSRMDSLTRPTSQHSLDGVVK
jgi:hypothetical protein